jgi:hypothetical protein
MRDKHTNKILMHVMHGFQSVREVSPAVKNCKKCWKHIIKEMWNIESVSLACTRQFMATAFLGHDDMISCNLAFQSG